MNWKVSFNIRVSVSFTRIGIIVSQLLIWQWKPAMYVKCYYRYGTKSALSKRCHYYGNRIKDKFKLASLFWVSWRTWELIAKWKLGTRCTMAKALNLVPEMWILIQALTPNSCVTLEQVTSPLWASVYLQNKRLARNNNILRNDTQIWNKTDSLNSHCKSNYMELFSWYILSAKVGYKTVRTM